MGKADTKRVEVRLPPELYERIEAYAKMKLHGSNVSEVVRTFINDGMRRSAENREVQNWFDERDRMISEGLLPKPREGKK